MDEPPVARRPHPSQGDDRTPEARRSDEQPGPQLLPVAAIIVLSLVILTTIGHCAVNLAADDEQSSSPPSQPVATPSFKVQPPAGCQPLNDQVVETINDEMVDPRLTVRRAIAETRHDGVAAVGATIVHDVTAIEAVSAIFAVDDTGKVFAISSDARAMTELPDGRDAIEMTPVSAEAQTVNACLRDG